MAVMEEMPDSIKILLPISATEYVHNTNEAEETREAVLSKKKHQSTPMKWIDNTLRQ
jgi:hypothetical protein